MVMVPPIKPKVLNNYKKMVFYQMKGQYITNGLKIMVLFYALT